MTKTTQAQAMRGLDTPEQDGASARQLAAQDANDKSEALAGKLDTLMGIIKLAAFAAEARRTLTAIYGIAHFIPSMKETISNCAAPANNWSGLQDNTGDVLVYVAMELEDVNKAFTDHAYDLARVSSPSAAGSVTVTKGGAA